MVWHGPKAAGAGTRFFARSWNAVTGRCDRTEIGLCSPSSTATDAARSRLNEIDIIQPALFAIQVALAALWRSWGIEPQAVVGHSMGEVAAAYVAGALSLEDAARVICQSQPPGQARHRAGRDGRGRAFDGRRAARSGRLRRSRVHRGQQQSHLDGVVRRSGSAGSNPRSIAGVETSSARMVKVDFASHSPQMDPLRADLLQALEGLEPRPASMPIYSTVTGMVGDGFEFDARYWARNLREPVLFSAAVQRLLEDGHDIFLEISPHPILLSAIQQGLHHVGQEGAVLPSMRREEEERTRDAGIARCALYPRVPGRLEPHLSRRRPVRSTPGASLAARALLAGDRDRRLRLSMGASSAGAGSARHERQHPLLGRHFKSAHPAETHFWEVTLDKGSCPIWTTIASKELRCCPRRSTWRWPWPPRSRLSEHNPSR